jgi:hypothetical protein
VTISVANNGYTTYANYRESKIIKPGRAIKSFRYIVEESDELQVKLKIEVLARWTVKVAGKGSHTQLILKVIVK